jgi:hypothetical protein
LRCILIFEVLKPFIIAYVMRIQGFKDNHRLLDCRQLIA